MQTRVKSKRDENIRKILMIDRNTDAMMRKYKMGKFHFVRWCDARVKQEINRIIQHQAID